MHQIRDLGVAARRFVEGGGEHPGTDGFLEIGDFLRPLVEQQDDQFRIRMVQADRAGDLLEQDGFATARRGDDDAALALAERGDQIDDAHAEEIIALAFQMDPLVREKRGESVEFLGRLIVGDGHAFDFDHFEGGEVFVALARRADADFDQLADAQAVIADQVGAEVDVIRTGAETALGIPQHREILLGHCSRTPSQTRPVPSWPKKHSNS